MDNVTSEPLKFLARTCYFPWRFVKTCELYNGELVSNNLNAYRRYLMVDVIEIFRTIQRKVDYAFYYN